MYPSDDNITISILVNSNTVFKKRKKCHQKTQDYEKKNVSEKI